MRRLLQRGLLLLVVVLAVRRLPDGAPRVHRPGQDVPVLPPDRRRADRVSGGRARSRNTRCVRRERRTRAKTQEKRVDAAAGLIQGRGFLSLRDLAAYAGSRLPCIFAERGRRTPTGRAEGAFLRGYLLTSSRRRARGGGGASGYPRRRAPLSILIIVYHMEIPPGLPPAAHYGTTQPHCGSSFA